MKFSLISDMHVDLPQQETPYDLLEGNVIVAGDTSSGLEGLKFLRKLENKDFTVFTVDGNHEHYRNRSQDRSVHETTARFKEDHQRYHDLEIPIVSCNGWYTVSNEVLWQNYMNDSRMCGLSGEEVTDLAISETNYLRGVLSSWEDHQRKGIVVTHTSPCLDTLNPAFSGHYSNDWYWNRLMEPLLDEYKEQILVWCHGHTHAFSDKIVHGVRVVCNPKGYPGENPDWRPFTIEA